MNWNIIDTGVSSAEENMRFDTALLENADQYAEPVLHLYEWEGMCATYGHFIRPEQFLDLSAAKCAGLSLAQRPTGGGIVFHIWDMAFSVMIPAHCPEFSQNTLENYAFVNKAVLNAVKELNPADASDLFLIPDDVASLDAKCQHFCMAKPTKYDVMWEGRKIAGAAQRKTRKGFLHQGTIALAMPCEELLTTFLLPGSQVKEAMQMHTYPLFKNTPAQEELREAKGELKRLLATHLSLSSSILGSSNKEIL